MIYRFDEFELDDRAGELRREGVEVRMAPKPLALLTLLVRERDRVVGRREIFARLWPDVAVTDASLSKAVAAVRRALDDRERRVVRTFPRRGHRFCAAVVEGGTVTVGPTVPTIDPERTRLLGRGDEVRLMNGFLADALTGRGRLVMIDGGAGIGKTRLLQEAAKGARSQGIVPLSAWCWDTNTAPTCWPWVQLIRGYMERFKGRDAQPPPAVRRLLCAEREPDPFTANHASETEDRVRLLDATAQYLKAASHRQPLLLVLDDLQWADDLSLRVLQVVARVLEDAPLVVACAHRDPPSPGEKHTRIAGLRGLPQARRCSLSGLSRSATRECAEAVAGRTLPSAVDEAIWRRTQGHPLEIYEVVRALRDLGTWSAPAVRSVGGPRGAEGQIRGRLEG